MKKVTVLGCTGSIGTQALDVIRTHPDDFSLYAMTGGSNKELILQQLNQFHPKYAAGLVELNPTDIPADVHYEHGNDAILKIAGDGNTDIFVNGISGYSSLSPLLASLKTGKNVALANKESIVCGHLLVNALTKQYQNKILPVDSEQSAIFQCIGNEPQKNIKNLLLTASGGHFWTYSYEDLKKVTVEQTLDHPTWNMGKKITIDSATLFNKGLEVIEASYLFDIPGDKIKVLIHPQSIVHSLVEFTDGTVMADMSNPDMRLPIQYALTYPDRIPSSCKQLDLGSICDLNFYNATGDKYPALKMSYETLKRGGTYPTVYNGANEAAVAAFIEKKISFTDIYDVVDYALQQHIYTDADCIENIQNADSASRIAANTYIHRLNTK